MVGRGRGKRPSRTGAGASWRGRSVVRWVAQAPALPSGRKWNRSQPGQGATDLLLPRPAHGKMQGEPARRAGEPSSQGEEPPPERLGGRDPFAQTDARRPTGQVMGHDPVSSTGQALYCEPGALRQAQDWRRSARRACGSARRSTSGPGWRSRSRRGPDSRFRPGRPPVPASPRPGR